MGRGLNHLVAPRQDSDILAAFDVPKLVKPLPISQRAALRDLAKRPLLADEYGYGVHRPKVIARLAVRGLADIGIDAEARFRATITPAGRALHATLPEAALPWAEWQAISKARGAR